MNAENKKRSPNFTNLELQILQRLCVAHYSIIENKKSDAVSWQVKSAEWEKIAQEFNSQTTTNRCSKVLKKKWENMKKNAKDKIARPRIYALGTGGGPPLPEVKLSPDEIELLNLFKLTASGTPAVVDDDESLPGSVLSSSSTTAGVPEAVTYEPLQDNTKESDKTVVTWENIDTFIINDDVPMQENARVQVNESEMKDVSGGTQDICPPNHQVDDSDKNKENNINETRPIKQRWSSYNPTMLRTPKSQELQSPDISIRRYRKRPFNGSTTNKTWTELGEEKKHLCTLKARKLENELKLQAALIVESNLRQEELKLKIELLKLEIEKKKKQ